MPVHTSSQLDGVSIICSMNPAMHVGQCVTNQQRQRVPCNSDMPQPMWIGCAHLKAPLINIGLCNRLRRAECVLQTRLGRPSQAICVYSMTMQVNHANAAYSSVIYQCRY